MIRLRTRIKLQKNTPTRDAAGQPIESWSIYATRYAKVRWTGVREFVERDDQQTALRMCELTLRYPREGRLPQALDRVLVPLGSTTLTCNVEGVILDDIRRTLRLKCVEAAA